MIEDDLRTMLRRRAEDITVEPRPWSELTADEPSGLHGLRPSPASPQRWLAVAAVLLAIGVIATLLVGSRTGQPPVVAQKPSVLPFDPRTAAPIWPTLEQLAADKGFDAAGWAAISYLHARAQGGGGAVLDEEQFDPLGGHAIISWYRPEAGDMRATSGRVYLRRIPLADASRWAVVGAIDDELALGNVQYRDGRLSFSVGAAPGKGPVFDLAAAVLVGDRVLSVGGDPVQPGPAPPGGAPVPRQGERIGKGGRIDIAVPDGQGLPIIRVHQVPLEYASVTEFAVQPEGGPAGGRLLTSGSIGNKTWRMWAMDRARDLQEWPCVVLTIDGRTASGPVCGIGPGNPADGHYFNVIGPAARELGQVLIFGVVDAEVDTVNVFPEPHDGTAAQAFADPAFPAGARMFAVAVPVSDPSASVELMRGTERLDRIEVGVDGPVGG